MTLPQHPASDPLTDALVQTSFLVMGVLTRVAAEHDLSLTQLRLLGILRDHRPRMTQLATALGLDKSTVSGLVERAERRGLVAREPNPEDARATDVTITPEGAALAAAGAERVREELEPFLVRLGAGEREGLVRVLGGVVAG